MRSKMGKAGLEYWKRLVNGGFCAVVLIAMEIFRLLAYGKQNLK